MRALAALGARSRLARRSVLGGRRAPSATGLLGLGLGACLAGFATYTLATVFALIAREGADGAEGARVLGLVFAAALAGMFVLDLHAAVATLLTDADLDLLRRAPIRPLELMALKLVDALPRTGGFLLTLVLPAIVAYARTWPVDGWTWCLVPGLLAALWALPLGLGLAAALPLLRLVPAARAREALGLISTLAVTALWLGNAFIMPRIAERTDVSASSVRSMLAALPPRPAWFPGEIAAQVVRAGHDGLGVRATALTALLLVAGAAALLLASAASARTLGHARDALGASGARPRRGWLARHPRPRLRAFLARDAALYGRDWTILGDVLTAALLWTLLPLIVAPAGLLDPRWLGRTMIVALTVGLGYEIASRALPLEREAIAWSLLAPIPRLHWTGYRYLTALLLAAPMFLTGLVSVAWVTRPSVAEAVGVLILGSSSLILACALGLWTGSRFGEPTWTHPRAMLGLAGRSVAATLLMAQSAFWLVGSAVLEGTGAPLALRLGLPLPLSIALAVGPLVVAGRSRPKAIA